VDAAAITESLDSLLIDREQRAGTLVKIAREGRFALEDSDGPKVIDLCWVDEVALAVVGLAMMRGVGVDLLYPAPAGNVAVLLAAQVLVNQFMIHVVNPGAPHPAVGLVTADPTMAERIWKQIRIKTVGDRVPIEEHLWCYRAGPRGESPVGRRRDFTGLIVGRVPGDWPIQYLIVDHLAGFVPVSAPGDATVEVYADPLDAALKGSSMDVRPLWGWSDSDLSRRNDELEVALPGTVPFSVATERLAAMAQGVEMTVSVAKHERAAEALERIDEDMRLLYSTLRDHTDRNFQRGLKVAWSHLATLRTLPCEPSRFDRFAGVPPFAARSTRVFEPELWAWAKTLSGDGAEYAGVLARDIGDLRASLDEGNPFTQTLRELSLEDVQSVVVTRTRTASRALMDALGASPDEYEAGSLTLRTVSNLSRQGTWPRAIVVGEQSKFDWHRVMSGLAPSVTVLAMGQRSALACASAVKTLHSERERLGGTEARARTWKALVGSDPPATEEFAGAEPALVLVEGAEYVPEPDPFESLETLFEIKPFEIMAEGTSEIARVADGGDWAAEVPAADVSTDCGTVFLERDQTVEVRIGPKIEDKMPLELSRGDVLLIGRRQGRVGLLEALEEKLADRPDLFAARLMIDRYHEEVRGRFASSGLSIAELHRRLIALGCDKTAFAVRSWVLDLGIMAPRDFPDLRRLNEALDLGMSDRQLSELYQCVDRRRVFRRAAARRLAEAARSSTVVSDETRVDPETGLSIADLRDAVIEATVLEVRECPELVPMTLIGRLEVAGD
jgi:hypothetical protein